VATSLIVEVARCKSDPPNSLISRAQILALEQDEDHEQEHDAGGGKRRQKPREDRLIERPAGRLWLLDLDGDRPVLWRLGRCADGGSGPRPASRLVELLLQV